MYWLSPILLYGSEIWNLRKNDKNIGIKRDDIFQKNKLVHTFGPRKGWRNWGRVESMTNWRETEKMQIKLAKTFNKNEQQQDANINAEL